MECYENMDGSKLASTMSWFDFLGFSLALSGTRRNLWLQPEMGQWEEQPVLSHAGEVTSSEGKTAKLKYKLSNILNNFKNGFAVIERDYQCIQTICPISQQN